MQNSSACTVTLATIFLQIINDVLQGTPSYTRTTAIGDHYDFVIVGAGTAGCVLANRLSEISKWSVLLLERGGDEPDVTNVPAFSGYFVSESNITHVFKTEPKEGVCGGRGCDWARGIGLGGSSMINGMIYVRGHKSNYDHWAELGNYGWDYNNVLHYFKKSEENKNDVDEYYHGFDGYLSVEFPTYVDDNMRRLFQSFLNLGFKYNYDVNAENQTGVTQVQYTVNNGRRHSANRAFLQPVLKTRPNLQVITGAMVSKVLIDEKTKTAYGVEYILNDDRNSVRHAYADKEVILSAGTINSPQILMLSGVGPAETLDKFDINVFKDSPVGHNLQDHMVTNPVTFNTGGDSSTIPVSVRDDFKHLLEYTVLNKGPLTTSSPFSVTTFMSTKYSRENIPDIKLFVSSSFNPDANDTLATNDHYTCPGDNSTIYPTCYYNQVNIATVLLYPKSRGLLTLRSADPFDDPVIYDGYWDDYSDYEVMLEGVRTVVQLRNEKLLKEAGWTLSEEGPTECSPYEFSSDDYWKCVTWSTVSTEFHPVGTCKMGPPGDETAVVDPELRVYGIDRLRVIDASIMPFIVGANTNAPTYMIAEKGADMVKKTWFNYY